MQGLYCTWTLLIFGIAMPVLFPLAILNLSVIYLVERFVIARFYRLPPIMDDKLVKKALEVLRFAPIMMLMNGFWILSNR